MSAAAAMSGRVNTYFQERVVEGVSKSSSSLKVKSLLGTALTWRSGMSFALTVLASRAIALRNCRNLDGINSWTARLDISLCFLRSFLAEINSAG